MFSSLFGPKLKLLALGALLVAILNAATFALPAVGGICLALWLVATGQLLGGRITTNESRIEQICVGILTLLSALTILGSAIYYLGPIPEWSLAVALAALTIVSILLANLPSRYGGAGGGQRTSRAVTSIIATLLCIAAWWSGVLEISITEAIRSPWLAIDPFAAFALGLAAVLIAVALIKSRKESLLVLFALLFLSAVSLVAVSYPLGYGFDPFIHRATVAHIIEHGTITPKPLYYIGQYVLEMSASTLFSIPLKTFDAWLVPVLASVLLTASAWIGFGRDRRAGMLALLLIPLGAFISTTPQSLAYVLTGCMLFLSLPVLKGKRESVSLPILWLIAISAAVVHPLAGIPALIYIALLSVAISRITSAIKAPLIILMTLIGCVTLPLIFTLQARLSGLAINFTPAGLLDFSKLTLSGFFDNRYSTWLDGAYLFIDNQLWILIILAIAGAIVIVKNQKSWINHLPLLTSLVWLINFWLLSTTLEFSFLIEYERTNYSERLLIITMIFLIPHVGMLISDLMRRLESRPAILRSSLIVLIGLAFAANVYGAYPRHDNYARSAGFNVSEDDFSAVYSIDEAGGDEDFIVLANQAVSSAALEAFGFKKYYNEDIFYYPIPTGGELYHYYLNMVEESPSRKTMLEAMDLAGVELGFFVVNNYWWQSNIISEHAKNEADEWFAVGENDAVMIFIYRK